MAYFLFKVWKERLYSLKRENVKSKVAKLPLDFVTIDEGNAALVRELRGEQYEAQFLEQLSMGDFGYYAFYEGRAVGYGWVKHCGSSDYFFRIGEGCCYLCRFFVHESMRGQGIYPELISRLIEKESDCHSFYIDVEKGNTASENGLLKVGFRFVKEFGFLRGFKHTFNKKILTE